MPRYYLKSGPISQNILRADTSEECNFSQPFLLLPFLSDYSEKREEKKLLFNLLGTDFELDKDHSKENSACSIRGH